jgi:glutamyl-tRNA reductase
MAARGPHLSALVTHARGTPAVTRAEFAVRAQESLDRAGRDGSALSIISLTTCHRVEVYLGPPAETVGDVETPTWWTSLRRALPEGGGELTGLSAMRHLTQVAVGLDSAVIAEDQILHQLRASVGAAEALGSLHGPLARAAQIALAAGRRARTYRTGPLRSLADRALESIRDRTSLDPAAIGRPLLVVGAGEMGRRAAEAAHRAGYAVAVASRNPAHAAEVATPIDGTAWPFDPGARLAEAGAVIVALRGLWQLSPASAEALAASGGPLIDLSFPPALPDAVASRLGPRLVSGDSLAGPADAGDGRMVRRLHRLAEEAALEFQTWSDHDVDRAAARILSERATLLRERALERLWRQGPAFDHAERERIEGMARQLAEDLLEAPLARLGHDGDGSRARAARDLFDL